MLTIPPHMTTESEMRALVESRIREVPGFPTPDIVFKDIMPILRCPMATHAAQRLHEDAIHDLEVDKVVGIESRGFLFGMPLAQARYAGFVAARKPGKLPGDVISQAYDLEYGSNTLVMQVESIHNGDRVVVVDDLLATGGTADAACKLVERMGGTVVSCLFLIELAFLGAREKKLSGRRIDAVFSYT